MNLILLLPQWLARRLIQPEPPKPIDRLKLKQRQLLPTLPLASIGNKSLQDDASRPGYRLQWRQ